MTVSSAPFLGGKIKLNQAESGYRAGIDAALLASAVLVGANKIAVEFGCGAGAALLSAARLNPNTRFIGLEYDADVAQLAAGNVLENGLSERVDIVNTDALMWKSDRPVDAVFFNPPFFDDRSALRAPKPEKSKAWINHDGLARWVDSGLKRLKEGGVLTMIHRADYLERILSAIGNRGGDTHVLSVHPRIDQPAKRIIVATRKVSKSPLVILPPLILHPQSGSSYTERADALLRGEAKLALLEV